jgi:hypothetical protein
VGRLILRAEKKGAGNVSSQLRLVGGPMLHLPPRLLPTHLSISKHQPTRGTLARSTSCSAHDLDHTNPMLAPQ